MSKSVSVDNFRRGPSVRATAITLEQVLNPLPDGLRKTKIICTLGIKTSQVDYLVKMIGIGMNNARLNFSHGDHDSHGKAIANVREAVKLTGKAVSIILDTKGPEIRTGFLVNHEAVEIKAGQTVKLVTDYTHLGDGNTIAISYKNIVNQVKPGATVLVADGSLVLTITEVGKDYVLTTAKNTAKIGERKNVNLPGTDVDIETITDRDRADLAFGAEQGVDAVAASFVRSAEDIRVIREALGPKGTSIMIISKIENEQGLKNFDEILEASDGVMVARGDLGMEIPPEKVTLAQKYMINKCNLVGKPVVTATQMLESMVKNPRPTRAEVSDVANAVFDGTDCVMLSGETAGGDFPLEAIDIMARTCLEAERAVDYYSLYLSLRALTPQPVSTVEAIASAAVEVAIDMKAKLIVCLTETGRTSRLLSKYNPPTPILVVTGNPQVARQANLSWGLLPHVDPAMKSSETHLIDGALKWAKSQGLVIAGDHVVAVHGVLEQIESGATSIVRVVAVP